MAVRAMNENNKMMKKGSVPIKAKLGSENGSQLCNPQQKSDAKKLFWVLGPML
jgi:hypothetical protein